MSTKPFKVLDANNIPVTLYGYSATQFVVGLAGEAPYTSIQTAIDDAYTLANSIGIQQVVYVKSSLYKENLLFKPSVAVVGTEVPSTLDNVSYSIGDVSHNYGVFVQGTHTFEDSSGEFNVKNIIFFPKDSYNEDIIDFAAGDGCAGNTYSFENCKFFAITEI
jgi:hypothetical protein